MASGIKDKVAILGMGCSKFGERWDAEAEDLIVEAFEECVADAGVETGDIQAAWFATAIEEAHVGKSGVPLAMALTDIAEGVGEQIVIVIELAEPGVL